MATPAKQITAAPQELPARAPARSLSVQQVLATQALRGSKVLAGHGGLGRSVERLNVMGGPDILPFIKPHELLLTNGYPLQHDLSALPALVENLNAAGLAALAVAPGRYLDALPEPMLAMADRLDFPVIELVGHVAFDEVIEQVLTELLNRQSAALTRSHEVHRALLHIVLAGGGLPELAGELAGLFGGAVVITATDGRVQATAGAPEALDRATGSGCFDASGRLRTEVEPSGLSHHGTVGGNHVIVPVVAARVDHGRIAVFSAEGRLAEEDVPTVEQAATVAALVVTKDLAVQAVESKYQGDFLRDLLTGEVGPESALAHATTLGWDLDRPLIVVVAELDADVATPTPGPDARPHLERYLAAWQSVVRPRDPKAPVVGFHREVVALLGAPTGRDLQRLVRDLVREVAADGGSGRHSFGTGVSRVVTTADQIPAAYEQARTAVRVGRRRNGRGSVAHFDTLGVFRLLSLIADGDELRAFPEELLGDLARTAGTAAEKAEAADLRRTLEVLLETNLNVAETARQLHFHYNTLRYRIAKLERMLGPFTVDAQLRLSLQVALQVLQMRGL
jgi:PucR family transcriptional regulator, purine catabolism regulatory protein